ncbi:ubiquitin-protein ligase TUL1 ASCRUDRAFT_74705 [Ascoidea rubescens DSM 1968]|uniref:RING-type E3 ubiquitin transferase n=1 Tax=Ascoidea rubescens DSM 1968 TaxID=1344418 RepID=A0A1D2VL12_9ASCO|nr:hypothetical protein ASCRUDRAFT_74705 [Ascoidea rubescens DSM 1968]ODV62285.1 hypothetical protein ASCRUDRAFT_74705 [Ascoidea rubescens DSM 1968]
MPRINPTTLIFFIIFLTFIFPSPNSNSIVTSRQKRQIKSYQAYKNHLRESIYNSTYAQGYGNATGFLLSYDDAFLNRNISHWPFPDRDYNNFIENQNYSILPNLVSKFARNIWSYEFLKNDNQINDGKNENVEMNMGLPGSANKKNQLVFFPNITGTLRGDFQRLPLNFTKIHMPIPPLFKTDTDIYPDWDYDNNTDNDNDDNIIINNNNNDNNNNNNNNNNQAKLLSNEIIDGETLFGSFASDGTEFQDDQFLFLDLDNNYNNATPSSKIGNITQLNGNIKLDIFNYENSIDFLNKFSEDSDKDYSSFDSLNYIYLKLNFDSYNQDDDHHFTMKGLYDQKTGNIISITDSIKFEGYWELPHLILDKSSSLSFFKDFNTTKKFQYLKSLQSNLDYSFVDFDYLVERNKLASNCEYVSYLHVDSINDSNLNTHDINEIEKELRNPIGRPVKKLPNLKISTGVFYSPDCGILLKINEKNPLIGVRKEVHLKSLRNIVLIGIIILFSQILLTIRQMDYTNTPSSISKISFYSISIMNLIDGSLCMLFILSSALIFELFIPLAISGFLAFILSSVFEVRYLILINHSQINERSINIWTALRGETIDNSNNNRNNRTNNNNNNSNNASRNDNASEDPNQPLLPTSQAPQDLPQIQQPTLPATQQTANTFPQDEQTIGSSIFSRSFFSLIIFTFLILNASMWSRNARRSFEFICFFLLNSFWVPQFFRNLIRGSSRSFKWEFIIGTSFIRFFPIAYITMVKTNPFNHHYDPTMCFTILIWLIIQIFLLFLQDCLGPRFLLPKSWLPNIYNYHPILKEVDLENGFGLERGDNTNKNNDDDNFEPGKFKVDCAICMNDIELPIIRNEDEQLKEINELNAKKYMVTPCRHIFHTECLEGWMKYKLQCPVCRSSLPPI